MDDTKFVPGLLAGDQLIVARVSGAQALRATENNAVDRLGGLIPVFSDWHCKWLS